VIKQGSHLLIYLSLKDVFNCGLVFAILKKNMIGVFDSGVGGLTVVKEIFKYLPGHQIIYFGDTARLPYGTKGADFVKRYSGKITKWLLKKGARVIVVACNTSSAWAADSLKEEFKGVPIFEMIAPAAKEAFLATKNKKIGIIGTPGTIKSGVYNKKLLKINKGLRIFSESCPLLVPLVEEGWTEGKITEEVLERYLRSLKGKDIDTLILGCTHYPLLENLIKKTVGDKVRVINPAKAIIKDLKKYLEENTKIGERIKKGFDHKFYFSDEPYNFGKISRLCFNKKIKPKIIDPFNN